MLAVASGLHPTDCVRVIEDHTYAGYYNDLPTNKPRLAAAIEANWDAIVAGVEASGGLFLDSE